MATFAPHSASFSAIPRPIPREPPVTSAYFPLSVIKHLLAQLLRRILGVRKSHVNRPGRGPPNHVPEFSCGSRRCPTPSHLGDHESGCSKVRSLGRSKPTTTWPSITVTGVVM